jgi:predicted amidohydrolase YtcJ
MESFSGSARRSPARSVSAASKLADFVLLEKDPHEVAPDQIMAIKVNRTVVGGKNVYPK